MKRLMEHAAIVSFAAGLILFGNRAAEAQQLGQPPNGAEFLQACQAGDKACSWLLLGLADTLNARNSLSDREVPPEGFNACIPPMKTDDLVRNVVGVMLTIEKVNPSLYQMAPASTLITSTLSKLYSCKSPTFQPPK